MSVAILGSELTQEPRPCMEDRAGSVRSRSPPPHRPRQGVGECENCERTAHLFVTGPGLPAGAQEQFLCLLCFTAQDLVHNLSWVGAELTQEQHSELVDELRAVTHRLNQVTHFDG